MKSTKQQVEGQPTASSVVMESESLHVFVI
jgi:hypothetical protein